MHERFRLAFRNEKVSGPNGDEILIDIFIKPRVIIMIRVRCVCAGEGEEELVVFNL